MSTVSCTTPNTYLLSICCSQLSGSREGDQCVLPLSLHPEIAGRFRACTVGADSSCSDGSSNDARFGGLGTTTEGSDGTPTSVGSPTSVDASADDASTIVNSYGSTNAASVSDQSVTSNPPSTVDLSNTAILSKEADADHASEISGSGEPGMGSTSARIGSGPGASPASRSSATRSRRVAVAPLLVGSLLATLSRW